MNQNQEIIALKREASGTGESRSLRLNKKIPAIVYGEKKDPLLICVDEKTLKMRIQDPGFFSKQCELKIDNETINVLPKDLQVHPVKESILHIDFLRVGENTTVTLSVPVKFSNENSCPGLKQGGVLNVVRYEVEIKTLVSKIPEFLEANLDGLEIGDNIHISSIKLDEGVKPTITDRDFTIATLAPPTVMKVEEEESKPDEEASSTEGESEVSKEESEKSDTVEEKKENDNPKN